jgi:hypothetical protein
VTDAARAEMFDAGADALRSGALAAVTSHSFTRQYPDREGAWWGVGFRSTESNVAASPR